MTNTINEKDFSRQYRDLWFCLHFIRKGDIHSYMGEGAVSTFFMRNKIPDTKASEVPNDDFLLNTLKTLFRPFRLLLDL